MNKVSITSGKYKGRKIATPGGATHPMGAREKLALFNMIADKIEGSRALDCFAGSGALGIEALSRGAVFVVFVEKNHKAAKIIRENLGTLGAKDGFEIIQADIATVGEDLGTFDVILADPPYDDFDLAKVFGLANMLKTGGILALSHPGESPVFETLKLLKSHSYARARISLYIRN